MTLDEAKVVLEKDQFDFPYISFDTYGERVVLDGAFSIEQLEAISVIMKHQEAKVTAE